MLRVLVGLTGLAATVTLSLSLERGESFTGLLHAPALVLLVFAPPWMVVISYPLEELTGCLRVLSRSIRMVPSRSRAALFDDLSRFAAELRQRHPVEALAIADESSHALLRQLAPLAIEQARGETLERTAATASWCLVSALRRSEEVLTTLARVTPATGLAGTVLGLVSLMKDLSRFERLGPSMALAMLCTLYGLVLANAVYLPFARAVHAYATVTLEEAKLVTRALVLLGEGRPLSELQALFELAESAPTAPAEAIDVAGEPG